MLLDFLNENPKVEFFFTPSQFTRIFQPTTNNSFAITFAKSNIFDENFQDSTPILFLRESIPLQIVKRVTRPI